MNDLSSETSIEFVVPVPQSILWLGGLLAAMLLLAKRKDSLKSATAPRQMSLGRVRTLGA
jgi:hypothetical protein